MKKETEVFARNHLMADIRKFSGMIEAADHKAPSLSSPFNAVIASPSFDKMYLEYLEGFFEDYFEGDMPLEDLLNACYREDTNALNEALPELKQNHPELFSPRGDPVIAQDREEESRYKKQIYNEALSLIDVIDIMDEKTADPEPSEREKEAVAFTRAMHKELRKHLESRKAQIGGQKLSSRGPEY